jgi:hypothetical protein
MTRARIAAFVIFCLAASPVLARDGCPSANVNDVMNDPVVRDAIADAWNDSHGSTPDEHEEGGWIYQCQMPNGDGTYRYYTQIIRWAPGTRDDIVPSTPHPDEFCRLVADFHTHPGTWYDGSSASDADMRASAEMGVPGILVWANSDGSYTVSQGGYPGINDPRDPTWTCPSVPPRPGSGTGEPHLLTLDGLAYDFQAIGDFSLVQATPGDLEIQARQQPYRDTTHVAVTTGLAIRDHDDRIEWTAGAADPIVNGRVRPMGEKEDVRLFSWGVLRRIDDGFLYLTTTGDRLTVNVGNESLDYFIRLAPHRAGKVRGLFGNFDSDPDNDIQSAGGRSLTVPIPEAVDSAHPLYAVFGASWRVPAGRSMFAKPFASTVDAASFPKRPPEASDADVAAAKAKCATQPLVDDAARRACVFDLTVTKNDAFLASAVRASRSAASVAPTAEGAVQPDREITGRLSRPDARAAFTIELARGAYIFDERGSHDTTWTVTGPDGAMLLDANQSAFMGEYRGKIVVTKPGRHAIAVSVRQPMTSGQFRFRIRTVPAATSKTIEVGQDVAGRIGTVGEEHTYRIPLGAGSYDLRPQATEDTAWNLAAPDGRGLLDGNQQEFMETVSGLKIPVAGTYTLTVRGRGLVGLGAYRFSVIAR